jgi:uncharacterized membrane protein YgcG
MDLLVIVAGIVVCAIGLLLLRRAESQNPSRRTVLSRFRMIMDLNLDPVRKKACERHGWTDERGHAIESEYRDYLALHAEHGGNISPWSKDLDLFWHEHILDTVRYEADCKLIFGYRIEHDPHLEVDPEVKKEVVNRTEILRARQTADRAIRKKPAPGASSSAEFTWLYGCGGSSLHYGHGGAHHDSGGGPSHDAGSHAGGHDGGGHSDGGGGHSCGGGHSGGGHSCGGHSCGGGHGCGGGH